MVDEDEAAATFPAIYDAALRAGMFSRSESWWRHRLLDDPAERRSGGGPLNRVLLELDGEPAAYALYRMHASFDGFVSTGHLEVVEAVGATPPGTRAIWRFLLDVDWLASLKATHLPLDHALLSLLAEPRRAEFRVYDATSLRLVDVEAALSARSYAGDGEITFEVEDAFCPWNAGHWRLTPGGAERTDSPGEIALDVRELGSVYLGGFTFTQLAEAGRVVELEPGALARADALFRTDRAPWCPEIF
jgi:predicted acetyltransferase